MASTRGLFMEEPTEEPSVIVYMGREIKVEDHFDDDWIEDALDEQAGFKGGGLNSSRMSQSSGRNHDSERDDDSNHSDENSEEESEEERIEEFEEEMDVDTSTTSNGPKRRGRRSYKSQPAIQQRRSQSSEPAIRPSLSSNHPPRRRGVGRSRTFDGRQTSEIFPHQRKPKNWSARQLIRPKEDLNKQFQEFLSKTGGITPTSNHPYQNSQQCTSEGIRRRQPRMPTSRKRVEQFQKLEYTATDIQDVLCEDDETFQRLKRVLTKKGAITNGVLQQRLHIFLKKAKDRQSKLIEQRKEDEDGKTEGETDNTTNLQPAQSDWMAMSMMDMFAQSGGNIEDRQAEENPVVVYVGVAIKYGLTRSCW
eukprot:scaffold4736_cov105-Cylindrotheca_fusiformis.AAC.10